MRERARVSGARGSGMGRVDEHDYDWAASRGARNLQEDKDEAAAFRLGPLGSVNGTGGFLSLDDDVLDEHSFAAPGSGSGSDKDRERVMKRVRRGK